MSSNEQLFGGMSVSHVEFYVSNIASNVMWLSGGYGFKVVAAAESDAARSVALTQGQIVVVLTEPRRADHPATRFVERHGDGPADIGLSVADVAEAFRHSVRRGATPVAAPAHRGATVTASIAAFGDVTYTFVQRSGTELPWPPDLRRLPSAPRPRPSGLLALDHFAVCVEPGHLGEAVDFHEKVLGFKLLLSERIEVGSQAMQIDVVQSESRAVTHTLIEADPAGTRSHIDEFLDSHGGPGVQHIAFSTKDIVASLDAITKKGVQFLNTPDTYYEMLAERVEVIDHPMGELRRLGILVDEDHDGKLYQIFARSVHPRGTLFLEIIERAGANSFGSGNIKALYQAVESDKIKSRLNA